MPFFEKNLTEVIKRNVRSGRLAYSTDMESFARKAQVIFLAEDTPQHLADLAIRIARLAPKPPILSIATPVSVGTATTVEKRLKEAGLSATIVSQPIFITPGCAVEELQLARPHHPGDFVQRCSAGAETDSSPAGDARSSRDCDQSRDCGTGPGIGHCICCNQDFVSSTSSRTYANASMRTRSAFPWRWGWTRKSHPAACSREQECGRPFVARCGRDLSRLKI